MDQSKPGHGDAPTGPDQPEPLTDAGPDLWGRTFHYTDEAGSVGIGESGVIRAGMKNRVHLTDGAYSPDEAASALFNNAPTHAGRGSHLVVVRVPQGTELIRGTMPNEVFTYGSLRGEILFNGLNPF